MSHNYLRVNTTYNMQAMSQWGIKHPEDIALKEKMEGIQQKITAKIESISILNRDCFTIIGSFLATDDIPAICETNKLFNQLFGGSGVFLKNQINGITRITSVKQLKAQAVGMQKYFPHEPAWQMIDVLRIILPNLKTLDFSETPSQEEMEELLTCFETLKETSPALFEKEITETLIMSGDQEVSNVLRPDELTTLYISITGRVTAATTPKLVDFGITETEIRSPIWQANITLNSREGGRQLLHSSPEIYLSVLTEMHPNHDWVSVQNRRTIKILADIHSIDLKNFCSGNPSKAEYVRRFDTFLESFCPNLSHFSSAAQNHALGFIINLLNKYKNTLLHLNCYKPFKNSPDCFLRFSGFPRQLEHISFPFALPTKNFTDCIDQCPKLKNVDLTVFSKENLKDVMEAVERLGDRCSRIEVLRIVFNLPLSDVSACVLPLAKTAAKFENLKKLSLYGPHIVTHKNYLDDAFPVFFQNSKGLKHLEIQGPVTTEMLIKLSKFTPRLEYLHLIIGSFDPLNGDPELFKVLVNLRDLFPYLKSHNLLYYLNNRKLRDFLILRDLSRNLQDMNTASRKLYKSLDLHTQLELRQRYLPLFIPKDSPLRRTILSRDLDRILSFTKPLVSVQGSNILEQVAWAAYQKSLDVFTQVFSAIGLGNDKLYPFNAPTALTKKLQVAVWERNGKSGKPSEHFDRLFAANRNPADVHTALTTVYKEYKLIAKDVH